MAGADLARHIHAADDRAQDALPGPDVAAGRQRQQHQRGERHQPRAARAGGVEFRDRPLGEGVSGLDRFVDGGAMRGVELIDARGPQSSGRDVAGDQPVEDFGARGWSRPEASAYRRNGRRTLDNQNIIRNMINEGGLLATLYQRVLAQMGEEICAGHYRPGEVIPAEPLLCARMDVSRVVIREAIKGLAAKGMVALRRKTGTIVLDPRSWQLFDADVVSWRARATVIDRKLAVDLVELRRIVEPAAARLAAERASDEDRERIQAACAAMERAVAGEGGYVAADLAFHRGILDACGNQFVAQMGDAIAAMLRTTFELVAATPGGPAASLPLHCALGEAIARHQPVVAERAALAIIDRAENDLRCRIAASPAPVRQPEETRR
jgi:DNA-binding FadR family transcriptional regulator